MVQSIMFKENTMQKKKLANYIIILAVISAIFTSPFIKRFIPLGNGMLVASIGSSIAFLLALICMKRLRATSNTKKLYNIVIIVSIVLIAQSLFSIFYVNHLTTTLQELSYDDVKVRTIMLINNFIVYFDYALIVTNIGFMVSIMFKEKENINWMLLGKLISLSYAVLNFILFKLLRALRIKSSLLQMINRSQVISIANSLLWVVGAIVMAMQIKKKLLCKSTTQKP